MMAFQAQIIAGPEEIGRHRFSRGDKVRLPDGRLYRVQEVDFREGWVRGRPASPLDWIQHFWQYGRAWWNGGMVRSR